MLTFVLGLTFFINTVFAANGYADFENGNDSNDGTSTSTSWKNSPGDSNHEEDKRELGEAEVAANPIVKLKTWAGMVI